MKKRLWIAALCLLLFLAAMPAAQAGFADVTDPEEKLAAATLQGLGIVAGTSENTFSPAGTLTRAQSCAMIVNTMGIANQVNTYSQRTLFADVLPGQWYTGIVNLAHAKGIINGYGNGTFGPDDKVTYGQFATMLLRLLSYSSEQIGMVWPLDYTNLCDELGLSDGLDVHPDRALTRGQAAVLLCRSLSQIPSGSSRAYYTGLSKVASSTEAVVLDNDADYAGSAGMLKICPAGGGGSLSYYKQQRTLSDELVGVTAAVLLDSAGRVIGAVPLEEDGRDTRVARSVSAILTDTNAVWQGTAGLVEAAALDGSTGLAHYRTDLQLSQSLEGRIVTLLLNSADEVVGMYEGCEAYPGVQVSAKKQALLLDVDAALGMDTGLVMVYELEGTPGIAYYDQSVTQSGALTGTIVTLMLDDRGGVVATVPQSTGWRDVVVEQAKASGITGRDGTTYRIASGAAAIVGNTAYTWSNNGYLQVNGCVGRTARLFYEDGVVRYVYIVSGTTGTDTRIVVADTAAPVTEFVRELGVVGSYSITKNGMPAQSDDLARYDVAYFDSSSSTLCVSDYQLTGYIQSASPGLDGAQTLTVSGCTVSVLESAWPSLEGCALGDKVTVLLTDDGKAAWVTREHIVARDTVGVLSTDGRKVKLIGSGLEITAQKVTADDELYGRLVRVIVTADELNCYRYSPEGSSGKLDFRAGTFGRYALAPACAIYEQAGDSYLYSLDGVQGQASANFDAVYWTDSLTSDKVASWRLNSAGKVDMLVLRDVTGNCYEYGTVIRYTGNEGIRMDSVAGRTIYANAATLTNGSGTSQKYLSSWATGSQRSYYGIALQSSGSYKQVTSLIELTASTVSGSDLFLQDEEWYVEVDGASLPLSANVSVYVESTGSWMSGEDAVRGLAAAGKLTVHYDRTTQTGAQVRIIVLDD